MEELSLDIVVDGQSENNDNNSITVRSIVDRSDSKESLAMEPIRYMLKESQRYLSIRYDSFAGHLTMKHQGVDAD